MVRKPSLARSTLIALPLGIISVGIGFSAFHLLNPEDRSTSVAPSQVDKSKPDEKEWPDVQQLKDSGIEPLSDFEIATCRQSLGLADETIALAHSDNYGVREAKDRLGREIPNKPALIVLHETVISAPETIRLFQTPHPDDSHQASYHMLVDREGSLIRFVPDLNRAYGSGYSMFGDFTVHSKSPINFSVNNVALHISLETPSDGRGDVSSHSGYTTDQYETLAKQVLLWQARYGIPIFRVTTHASVDRSHSRYDPRTFRWDSFDDYHRQHAATCGLSNLTLS